MKTDGIWKVAHEGGGNHFPARRKMSTKKRHQEYYTIGEVSRIYGVTARALRLYEERGLLHSARKGSVRVRVYDADGVSELQAILKGKHLGFTLTEIAELMHRKSGPKNDLVLDEEELSSQLRYLQERRAEIDEAIEELREAHQRLLRGGDRNRK